MGGGNDPLGLHQQLQPYVLSSTSTNPASGQSNSAIQGLLQNLQKGQQQQQSQYLSQYKNLMNSVNNTAGQVQGQFNQLGIAGNDRINQQANQQMGQVNSSIAGRGLGNTTIANSLQNGVNLNKQYAQNDLQSQIAGQKIGADMQLGQMQQSGIQSLQQTNPQLNTYMSLISALMGNASPGGLASAVQGTYGQPASK